MAPQAKSDRESDISPLQCRMARAALAWGIRDLAKAALISHDTVVRFERGEELRASTMDSMREAFARNGVVFLTDEGEGQGVRVKKRRGKR